MKKTLRSIQYPELQLRGDESTHLSTQVQLVIPKMKAPSILSLAIYLTLFVTVVLAQQITVKDTKALLKLLSDKKLTLIPDASLKPKKQMPCLTASVASLPTLSSKYPHATHMLVISSVSDA